MSISILIKLILFSKWCNFALVLATIIAFLDISIAVATHFGLSLIKDKIVSQIKLNIPTYSSENLPENLISIDAVKPGSRNL